MPARHSIEPAARRKPRHGNIAVAEALDGLRGDLDITEERDMTEVHQPDLVDDPIRRRRGSFYLICLSSFFGWRFYPLARRAGALLHLENCVIATEAVSLRRQV